MHKIIILNNKKCQFISEDVKLFKKLHNFLSYKIAGSEFMYNGGWSGITYMMTKGGKFDLGLITKVKLFLESKNEEYLVEDTRPPKIINKELDISVKLKEHVLVPREHQIRILNAVCANEKGIVRGATGCGKTLSIALIIAKLNKPSIVFCVGIDICYQFYELFSKLFNEKIGYIGNGICDPQRITIASIWTIGRALSLDKKNIFDDEEYLNEKDMDESNNVKILNCLKQTNAFFCDECHTITNNTMNLIYRNIDPEYIFGFSGTPFKDDNTMLVSNSILGEQIIDVPASELIEKGILAKPIIKFITVPKMHLPSGSQYLSVYKDYIVENEIRNDLIIKSIQELLSKRYVPLVLFKQIKHGDILFKKITNAGIKCGMLYGNDSLDERNKVKAMLVNKEIDLILSSTIFDIGLNLEELSGLVLCGGGKSSIRALQRIGRVLRMIPGKTHACCVEFYDQAKYLKAHSMKRYNVYKSEPGFKIIKSKEMK